MKPRKFEIIECPHCGREYLPAEIFVPHPFFGRPRDIVRDVYGHILDFEGNSMDVIDTYTCDNCNTEFQVRAKITFVVEPTKLENFDEPYVSKMHTNTLFLSEE